MSVTCKQPKVGWLTTSIASKGRAIISTLLGLGLIACGQVPKNTNAIVVATDDIQGFVGFCASGSKNPNCIKQSEGRIPDAQFVPESFVIQLQSPGATTSNPANRFPQTRTEDLVKIGPLDKALSIPDIDLVTVSVTTRNLSDIGSSVPVLPIVSPQINIGEIRGLRW